MGKEQSLASNAWSKAGAEHSVAKRMQTALEKQKKTTDEQAQDAQRKLDGAKQKEASDKKAKEKATVERSRAHSALAAAKAAKAQSEKTLASTRKHKAFFTERKDTSTKAHAKA